MMTEGVEAAAAIGSLAVLALVLVVAWTVYAARRPWPAYLIVLFSFVVGYRRLGGLLPGAAAFNSVEVFLGDLLWIGLLFSVAVRWLRRPELLRLPRSGWEVMAVVPYVLLSLMLPLAGVLIYGRELTETTTAFRHLQWFSFFPIACLLIRDRTVPIPKLFEQVATVLAAAGIVHVAYAAIQFAHGTGVLGSEWVLLDELYRTLHEPSEYSFFYPRPTGLFVNPNSFGMFCGLLILVGAARAAVYTSLRDWKTVVLFALGGLGLLASMSRSSMVGVSVGMLLVFGAIRSPSHLRRWALACGGGALVGVGAATAAWSAAPPTFRSRIGSFADILVHGPGASESISARWTMWQELFATVSLYYPLGTLVSPIYATGRPVDNYFMLTFVQGTPLYTVSYLLLLIGSVVIARRGYRVGGVAGLSALSLALCGWVGVLAGGGIGMSPMLQPSLVALFWSGIGLVVGGYNEVCHSSRRSRGISDVEALTPR